ncbi:hypothetical protein ZIOFF_020963 [Zingiber officinale]|uniref:Myotubularin phosphatase domain-containing protein n=1 Tax=Zingiber officinale TaxID=94328 RepID=A0A8J5H8Z8_ZINOF|nr:hypothetical protein ZIOFF_020963 [Zingiber officinale]
MFFRKLYIADARPRKNALANGAMGGGSESSANYFQSEVCTQVSASMFQQLDKMPFLVEFAFVLPCYGPNLLAIIHKSDLVFHIENVYNEICDHKLFFVVHQALVEKDWLAFGHPFADRMGFPTLSGNNSMPELTRQSSVGSLSSSPLRIPSGSGFTSSAGNTSHGQTSTNSSPIFLQEHSYVNFYIRFFFYFGYVNHFPYLGSFASGLIVSRSYYACIHMLLSSLQLFWLTSWTVCFLIGLGTSCLTVGSNILEKERQQKGVADTCGCLWVYLAHLRSGAEDSHVHYNPFFDPVKYDGALLPPAAALAPTLWPQFHLRWACPTAAGPDEIQSQWRTMTKKFSETTKEKETAEMEVKELQLKLDLQVAELQKERQLRNSALAMAKRTNRECLAIKRAVQSLGCKVNFLGGGSDAVNTSWLETREGSSFSSRSDSDARGHPDEKADLSVIISATEDSRVCDFPDSFVCESICPLRSREGCKWPDAACAQFGSQFVGLKANFDAFDRLSIYDSYFGAD